MGKIIMSELADRLAEKAGIEKRVAQTFLSAVIDTIRDGVNNDKIVKIGNFFLFKIIKILLLLNKPLNKRTNFSAFKFIFFR